MGELKELKEQYDNIPIPAELSKRVQETIKNVSADREEEHKIMKMERRNRIISRTMKTAAAVALGFTVLLNTSTSFAKEMSEIPVLGAVARVLTFRSYETNEDDLKVSVEIPSVEMISEDTNGLAKSINQEIYDLCEQYAAEAIERAEEYKKAFMETGGTEEEWAAHNIAIKVWYEIKSQTDNYLSFAVMGSENWTSAYNETRYYNIDLNTEKIVTLEDLLGKDYVSIANESIKQQMQTRTEQEGTVFWTSEEGGFTGITDDQKFYINENENPVIVFDKYAIAPGSEGEIEFEITK